MTVKELLGKMVGVKSYGIYTKNGEVLNAHPTTQELVEYLDKEVNHFDSFIYDDYDYDIQGNKFGTKNIRSCVYLEVE